MYARISYAHAAATYEEFYQRNVDMHNDWASEDTPTFYHEIFPKSFRKIC